MSITDEDLLALLPARPTELLRDLQIIMSYNEAIETMQRAIERDVVMLGDDAMIVSHDGEFYYA